MRAVLRLWRYLYGENPLHLLAVLACFAIVGYAVSFVYADPSIEALLIWFLGAVIGHDLVLYPLYALADQPLTIARWARRKALPRVPVRVPVINYIRAPVLGSAVLGLVYLPTITQHGGDAFEFAAGHPEGGQYQNWLGITGLLFLISAVLYALRLGAAAGRGLARRLRHPGTTDEDRTPVPVAAGAAVAAPVGSAVTPNGRTPIERTVPADEHPPARSDPADDADAPSTLATSETATSETATTVDRAEPPAAPAADEIPAAPATGHTEPETAPAAADTAATEEDDVVVTEGDPPEGTHEPAPTEEGADGPRHPSS